MHFYGFDWGVPKAPYWRNHYQDEAFVMGLLFKMGPDNLNPHYFINPTFHYYTLLFSIKLASFLGIIDRFSLPVKTSELGQPVAGVTLDDYAKMYLVGRFLTVIEGILLIVLIFFIGRNLYNELAGIIAAAFTAILPTVIYQSHFLVVDAPALFWFTLAFWFLTTAIESLGVRRWSIISGVLIGIAVGTKYTNILLFLPFLYKLYLNSENRKSISRIINRNTAIAAVVTIIFFLFTTPYALLSFDEFLRGNANGFGGIFGPRGLLYYNAYAASLISPFSLATFHSLRLPLTLFSSLGVLYLLYKREKSDLLLLVFIIPFYLMMIYHASPHLRHIVLVLPFLMIATGRMVADIVSHAEKKKFLRPLVVLIMTTVFVYTLLFTLSMIKRITRVDTRIACAEWVRKNVAKESIIGLASYFPWNYTPPVEMITDKITLIDYNYDRLLALKPDYFIITEYELKDAAYSKENRTARTQFVALLFKQHDYVISKEFKRDFEFLGLKFPPNFPNMDWNAINPVIYVFKAKS